MKRFPRNSVPRHNDKRCTKYHSKIAKIISELFSDEKITKQTFFKIYKKQRISNKDIIDKSPKEIMRT